mmetsp:Transcript_27081/g.56263  ORF Transcript_27081/g.56263 Transcript_27081/m.56263 type:complete len:241 (+) Transcript_27081:391-1113(+)
MHGNVKYFVIFCNLVNILDIEADTTNHERRCFKNCSLNLPFTFLAVGRVVKAACSDTMAILSACSWKVRGLNSTTLANSGTTNKAKTKLSALSPRDSPRAASLRCFAVFMPSGDKMNGCVVVFADRWSESIARRIRKTDLPSQQSAANSPTGSSSSSSSSRCTPCAAGALLLRSASAATNTAHVSAGRAPWKETSKAEVERLRCDGRRSPEIMSARRIHQSESDFALPPFFAPQIPLPSP